MTSSKPSWQSTADACHSNISNAIPASHRIPPACLERLVDPRNVIHIPDCCGVLTQREIEITSIASATELLENIKNWAYTAVEVTTAFCKRASIAHQLVRTVPFSGFYSIHTENNSFMCSLRYVTANSIFRHGRPTVSPRCCMMLLWLVHKS